MVEGKRKEVEKVMRACVLAAAWRRGHLLIRASLVIRISVASFLTEQAKKKIPYEDGHAFRKIGGCRINVSTGCDTVEMENCFLT